MRNSGSLPRLRLIFAILFIGGALLLGWMVWTFPKASTVSLDLVQYKRLPRDGSYAELRLSNNTRTVIQYPVMIESDELRSGQVPILCREKLSGGWTKEKWDDESKGLKFSFHDLHPRQNATFLIPIQPNDPPKQVGLICKYPEIRFKNGFRRTVDSWIFQIKAMLKIEQPPTDRVWCSDILVLPVSESSNR
jgi:hypothetical protein